MTSAGTLELWLETGSVPSATKSIVASAPSTVRTRVVMSVLLGTLTAALGAFDCRRVGPIRHRHLDGATCANDAVLPIRFDRLVFGSFGTQGVGKAVVA